MTHIKRIDEMYDSTTKLYHITPVPDIKKFEIRHKQGMGTSFYGAGVYFTKDLEVIDYYKKLMWDSFDELYMYTAVLKPTAHIYNEDDEEKGGGLYLRLCDENYGDEVEASKEIVKKYKVDGIEYSSSPEDGDSIVIYNPNVIKIVGKEKLEKDWNDDDEW